MTNRTQVYTKPNNCVILLWCEMNFIFISRVGRIFQMPQEMVADRKLKIACVELKEPHSLSDQRQKPYERQT